MDKDLIFSFFKTSGVVVRFPSKVALLRHSGRAADDHCLERNYPVRDYPCIFQHQEMVAVNQSDNGIRRLFHAFDMIRIDIKYGFVESGQFYHEKHLP